MQHTTHKKMNKIELSDTPVDITVLNPNFDTIDASLFSLEEIDKLKADIDYVHKVTGYLENLETTNKANLVYAINEIAQSGGGGGGAPIPYGLIVEDIVVKNQVATVADQKVFTIPFDDFESVNCHLVINVRSIWKSPETYTITGKTLTFVDEGYEIGTKVFFSCYYLGKVSPDGGYIQDVDMAETPQEVIIYDPVIIDTKVSEHNASATCHGDIRGLIGSHNHSYNNLLELPNLTLKANKNYVDTQDNALDAKIGVLSRKYQTIPRDQGGVGTYYKIATIGDTDKGITLHMHGGCSWGGSTSTDFTIEFYSRSISNYTCRIVKTNGYAHNLDFFLNREGSTLVLYLHRHGWTRDNFFELKAQMSTNWNTIEKISSIPDTATKINILQIATTSKINILDAQLLNGWKNYGGSWGNIALVKSGNTVTMTGLIKDGSKGSNTQLMTLPPEYRPSTSVISFAQSESAVNTFSDIRVNINTDGSIYFGTSVPSFGNWVSISTVTWNI